MEPAKSAKEQPKGSKEAPMEVKSPPPPQPAMVAREELPIRELPSVSKQSAVAEAIVPPVLPPANGRLPVLEAPTAQPVRAQRTSGGVVPGRLLRRVDPVYPDKARYFHLEGEVVLDAVILPNGKVGSVKVVKGHPLLVPAAVDAVRAWRYEPFLLNGTAVQGQVTILLNFNPRR